MAHPDASTAIVMNTLVLQARFIDVAVTSNVAGVTHEESLVAPESGGNGMNWVLGHLVHTYGAAQTLLGSEPTIEQGVRRYARGSVRITSEEALPFAVLVAAWEAATREFSDGLRSLAQRGPPPVDAASGDEPPELVASLAGILFHQAYHAGQLGTLRRLIGKPGAIR